MISLTMKEDDRAGQRGRRWPRRLWDKIYYYTQSPRHDFRYRRFRIGKFTYGKPRILFKKSGAQLSIGSYTSISKNVTIFLGGEHRIDWGTTYPFNAFFPEAENITGHPATKGDVVIGSDVWIGYGASILSGVTIGNGAVIGAFSVIAQNVADYEVVAGDPARHVRFRFDKAAIEAMLKIQWWNWNVEKVRKHLPLLMSPRIDAFLDAASRDLSSP